MSPTWELSQGLVSALTPNPSSLLLSYISPRTTNKTQGKGHKSKVKLYFTVIFFYIQRITVHVYGDSYRAPLFFTKSFTYS